MPREMFRHGDRLPLLAAAVVATIGDRHDDLTNPQNLATIVRLMYDDQKWAYSQIGVYDRDVYIDGPQDSVDKAIRACLYGRF
jgi:hypothetical protein